MTTARAWSTLSIKSVGDGAGKRTFTGIASTPSTDRMDDIVAPEGCQMTLPMPFLWQHQHLDPIGWITAARVSKKGIEIDGEVADIPDEGPLKDRLTLAWQMLKARLVRGLSIGFRPIESARIENSWGTHFLKSEIYEISAVTVPANADCGLTSIKSIDAKTLSALGLQRGVVRLDRKYFIPPSSKTNTTEPRAALGQSRKGVVRLADPPGASGITKAEPA